MPRSASGQVPGSPTGVADQSHPAITRPTSRTTALGDSVKSSTHIIANVEMTDVGIATPAITAAGDTWAVVDTDDGDVWLRGADASASAPTPA